jgi:hypothetical protein
VIDRILGWLVPALLVIAIFGMVFGLYVTLGREEQHRENMRNRR